MVPGHEDSLPLEAVLSNMRSRWASSQLEKSYGARTVALARALLNSEEMRYVWEGLYKIGGDLPDDYCEYAVLQHNVWHRLSGVPGKRAQKELQAAALAATWLAERLRACEREITLVNGWYLTLPQLLTVAARHRRAIALGRKLKPLPPRFEVPMFAARYTGLDSISVPEVLDGLAEILKGKPKTDIAYARPTKPNDPNAERTFIVRRLAQFLAAVSIDEIELGWIVRTANVLFSDVSPVDVRHVRTLIGSLLD